MLKSRLGIRSVRDVVAILERASAWLTSLGIPPENCRLDYYRKQLTALADAVDQDPEAVQKLLTEEWGEAHAYATYFEAYDWAAIYTELKDVSDPGLVERLRQYRAGPRFQREERPANVKTTHPRNIGVELSMAALLTHVGIEVDWSSEADIAFFIHGHPVFIECKRPSSDESIRERVDEALEQLERRYDSCEDPENARGLVGLSITRALNPEEKALFVPDQDSLQRRLEADLRSFCRNEGRALWGRPSDRRTIGGLIEFRCIAVVDGLPTPSTQWALATSANPGVMGTEIFRELDKLMLGGRTFSGIKIAGGILDVPSD